MSDDGNASTRNKTSLAQAREVVARQRTAGAMVTRARDSASTHADASVSLLACSTKDRDAFPSLWCTSNSLDDVKRTSLMSARRRGTTR